MNRPDAAWLQDAGVEWLDGGVVDGVLLTRIEGVAADVGCGSCYAGGVSP